MLCRKCEGSVHNQQKKTIINKCECAKMSVTAADFFTFFPPAQIQMAANNTRLGSETR